MKILLVMVITDIIITITIIINPNHDHCFHHLLLLSVSLPLLTTTNPEILERVNSNSISENTINTQSRGPVPYTIGRRGRGGRGANQRNSSIDFGESLPVVRVD